MSSHRWGSTFPPTQVMVAVMSMVVQHEGSTHFGDDPKSRVNHCFANVSAAEMLKVKLLQSRCLPMKKPRLNEELFLERFVRRWPPFCARVGGWVLVAHRGQKSKTPQPPTIAAHGTPVSFLLQSPVCSRGRFATTFVLEA